MELAAEKPNLIRLTVNRQDIVIGPTRKEGDDVALATRRLERTTGEPMPARVFDGPGEYEVQGIMIDGVASGAAAVSYHILSDGLTCAALDLQKPEDLTDQILEQLQPANILCVWLETGSVQDLVAIVGRFECSVVVPVGLPFSQEELEKELQLTPEKVAKFKVTAKEIAGAETQRLIQLG